MKAPLLILLTLLVPLARVPATAGPRAQGTVTVQIVIDEKGDVASPRQAQFSPLMVCGSPIKVTGVNTYNFVIQ